MTPEQRAKADAIKAKYNYVAPQKQESDWFSRTAPKAPERNIFSPIVDTAKAGYETAKTGLTGLLTPPEMRPEDIESAYRGGGIGAGAAETVAQVAKAGVKGVQNLGKVVGGIGAIAASPVLGPSSALGSKIGEQAAKLIPDSAAMQFEEFLQRNPQISEDAEMVMDIANLAFPEAMKRGAPVAQKLQSTVEPIVRQAAEPVVKAVEQMRQLEPMNKLRGYVDAKTQDSIKYDVGNLLKATRSISKKVQEAEARGADLQKILEEPKVFKGIKVEKGKINPDQAVDIVDSRIDAVLEAKRKMLPKIDQLVHGTSRDVVRAKAIENISGKYLPEDEATIIASINKQIDAMPEFLKPSQIDEIRAKARQSARNAKGMQKSQSEYAAIENAARDTVFEITDNLPVSGAQEYKALNDYVKNMITTKQFLDETLRNQVVKGGRMRGYAMRVIGSVAGSSYGILGAIAGSELGGVIADIVTNNSLGSSMKMQLIRELTDEPKILEQAQKLLGEVEALENPLLPEGNKDFNSQTKGAGTMELPAESASTIEGRELSNPNIKQPENNLSGMLALPQGNTIELPGRGILQGQEKLRQSQSLNPSSSLQNAPNNTTAKVPSSSIKSKVPQKSSKVQEGTPKTQKTDTSGGFDLVSKSGKKINWDNIPEEGVKATVPLNRIRVQSDALDKAMSHVKNGDGSRTNGPIEVALLEDGSLAIVDGHHRAVQKLLQGDKNIEATVYSTKHSASSDTIYDGHNTTLVPTNKAAASEPKTAMSGGGKGEAGLIAEAKKYKSAEEFAQSQISHFHGGENIDNIDMNKSNYAKTFFLTDKSDYAALYAGKYKESGKINGIALDPKANLIDIKNATPEQISAIKKVAKGTETGKTVKIQKPDGTFIQVPKTPEDSISFYPYTADEIIDGAVRGKSHFAENPELVSIYKKLGYDGMISYEEVTGGGKNIGVWNKDVVKTKQEIIDIWNKANNK